MVRETERKDVKWNCFGIILNEKFAMIKTAGKKKRGRKEIFLLLSESFPELYRGFCAASVLYFHRNELKRGNLSDLLNIS